MSCPNNIKVCISTRFFLFPYEYVTAQNDVGGQPVYNLIVYVPTDEDVKYVDKKKLSSFHSIRILKHDNYNLNETRLAKKNATSTIVYWNPVMAIDEIGVGETRVFSVLLTNDLFQCSTMIVDHNTPLCPIQFHHVIDYKKLNVIAGEEPLYYINKLLDDNLDDFIICFNMETPTMIKILNIKKILCMFEYRKNAARYVIYLPSQEVDSIFNKLMWERVRRLMKGDVNTKCTSVNRHSLQYLKIAMDMVGIDNNSKVVVNFIMQFQPIILMYHIVPDVIIKLNTLDRQKRVRLYCKHDTLAITTYGTVPINLPDDNAIFFDYSDINNNKHLFERMQTIVKDSGVDNLKVTAARYNYFF
ncbi:Odv-ec43 [Ectropis obliqua nucleopolyhedrovirus]|uniref:Odv-ec43 n=1 Tax=Ectropis obliqua nucleopolyhedrovirus TaxID=59376 RepID=A0EYY8_9ABAC|nr:Odv-ec43 [Ectropis obliqua nucleopolyhedrovirus]ABI35768.1 Odv-ec43 [Ectropis obliqua nucleopolyhedrovirus]AGS47935.1 putative 44.8 kDa protein [Ectropis obliqua nucleopolyhedrovirus]QWV59647.1 Odv-ec43 [Ectropis obliqua nucleopolyhedrovirus]UYO72882.1 Odv-ec43 [Ectropis obliqua nucleopolyhedrovirus]